MHLLDRIAYIVRGQMLFVPEMLTRLYKGKMMMPVKQLANHLMIAFRSAAIPYDVVLSGYNTECVC